MNIPQGPWYIDDLLTFTVITTVFGTGVATDADAVPAYRVYEDETTTPILTGNMALLDSANTAGLYSEQITLSAANGFEAGKTYSIHVAATVSSVAGASSGGFKVIGVLATPTNITAGTIATVTNLTNAPTNGDLTATMKTSVTTAATAATPTIASTQVFNNTGTWTGNLVGTVSTVTTVTTATNLTNAATNGDFTATMKTSIGTAVAASAVSSVTAAVTVGTNNDKTGYSLTVTPPTAVENANQLVTTSATTPVLVDVKKINGTTVNGDGGATPWGP